MENITWLGHASFMLKETSGKIYYIDPFQLPKNKELQKADIIFVTHAHYDHFSQEDILKILNHDTTVVATPDVLEKLQVPDSQKFPVEPNKSYEIKGFKFSTVPAYNVKPEKLQFHPQKNRWVGYILELNGKKIYHPGDTDYIPEMRELSEKHIDIALLPMGGTYTMDVDQMIEAALAIKPKTVVPMHYKGIKQASLLGDKSSEAEERLKAGVKNAEVVILEEFK